jgi:hypothetical protein
MMLSACDLAGRFLRLLSGGRFFLQHRADRLWRRNPAMRENSGKPLGAYCENDRLTQL